MACGSLQLDSSRPSYMRPQVRKKVCLGMKKNDDCFAVITEQLRQIPLADILSISSVQLVIVTSLFDLSSQIGLT